MLKYKGYIGHVEFDEEAEIFHGEVINTRDVITFQGSTVKALKKAFIYSSHLKMRISGCHFCAH